jgi:flagellar assembly factor FliW
MRINTTRFGDLEIDEAQVFEFPMGLLGFAEQKKYVIIDHSDDSPFKWLQCITEPELAFIITDPHFFMSSYHIEVRQAELHVISPVKEDDLILSVIMTIPENPREMSANLLAPLLFNMDSRRGMQYVLTNQKYGVKYYVFKEQQSDAVQNEDGGTEAKAISLS